MLKEMFIFVIIYIIAWLLTGVKLFVVKEDNKVLDAIIAILSLLGAFLAINTGGAWFMLLVALLVFVAYQNVLYLLVGVLLMIILI